jgi:hypothetical protein
MNLFARITIQDASFVIQVIQLVGQQQQVAEDFFSIVLDSWIKKVSDP